jgi:hypothetical protein
LFALVGWTSKKFTCLNGSYTIGIHGNQRHGRTAAVNEFNLICNPALVDVDNGPYITAIQFLMGRLTIEDYERSVAPVDCVVRQSFSSGF